jgi:hypothetical protein
MIAAIATVQSLKTEERTIYMRRLKVDLDLVVAGLGMPPGQYLAKLTKVEKANSKTSGKPMLVWNWLIADGEHAGVEILSFTSFQSRSGRALLKHLAAFGLKGQVDVELRTPIGRRAVIVADTRTVVRGQYKYDLPRVVNVLPEQDWQRKEEK